LAASRAVEDAAAFASASAATAAILLGSSPEPRRRADGRLSRDLAPPARDVRPVEARHHLRRHDDAAAARGAIRTNTRSRVETPSNPLWKVTDIAADRRDRPARRRALRVDTPRHAGAPGAPRAGADLVLHATTKYLAATRRAGRRRCDRLATRFRAYRAIRPRGAVPSPFRLLARRRGIARCRPGRAHSDNALRVATFLHGPHASRRPLPGLRRIRAHGRRAPSMAAFGGMLSVQVRGDAARR